MFRDKKISVLILVLLAIIVLTFSGCGSNGTGSGYDLRENLDIAWGHFAGADYSDAIDKFNEVLDNVSENAEAYLGLGWSHAFLGQLPDAVANFGLVSGQPEIVDAYMGLAAVYRDLPNYQAAISNADDVISADSSYQFSRRTSIDYRDAHLIKAQSYYRLGSSNFPEAHIEVNYLCDDLGLDPVPDPSTLEPAEYEQALVDKIAELTALISD
ncbi:MAG TPA: tetratricopeptide repeat protein [candidate division Zixibacteria bacterium]|nr:tetratricopeptide repeat protein [candidate division Zixibacteria bacterium]